MSYKLFKPDRFLCEQELSSYAFNFKGPAVEFTDPALADGIAENTTIPGRYYLSKTVVAFTARPGLKVVRGSDASENPSADFDVSWTYGCPHRCSFCEQIHLCKNYPYIATDPRIEHVELKILQIARTWKGNRPFVCEVGNFSDLLALEHLTGWLARLILFFARQIAPHGQLQFLTRSENFDLLADLDHHRATRVGVSVTPQEMINLLEPGTAPLSARLRLITGAAAAGYPLHISLSPVFPVGEYMREYEKLLHQVKESLLTASTPEMIDLSCDVLLHHVKPECEPAIAELAPELLKGMVSRRRHNRARLTYPDEIYNEAIRFFRRLIADYLPAARVIFIA